MKGDKETRWKDVCQKEKCGVREGLESFNV